MKFIRFVSKREFEKLMNGEIIYPLNKDDKGMHFFEYPRSIGVILPSEKNYRISLKDAYEDITYPKQGLSYYELQGIVTGTTAEDYAVVIEIENARFSKHAPDIGFYSWDIDNSLEIAIKEFYIDSYSLEDVQCIYEGNLYAWKNIHQVYPNTHILEFDGFDPNKTSMNDWANPSDVCRIAEKIISQSDPYMESGKNIHFELSEKTEFGKNIYRLNCSKIPNPLFGHSIIISMHDNLGREMFKNYSNTRGVGWTFLRISKIDLEIKLKEFFEKLNNRVS